MCISSPFPFDYWQLSDNTGRGPVREKTDGRTAKQPEPIQIRKASARRRADCQTVFIQLYESGRQNGTNGAGESPGTKKTCAAKAAQGAGGLPAVRSGRILILISHYMSHYSTFLL